MDGPNRFDPTIDVCAVGVSVSGTAHLWRPSVGWGAGLGFPSVHAPTGGLAPGPGEHRPDYIAAAAAKSLQSCPTLCNPMDYSPPGSPVPGILQARTLEWVAICFSNA